MSNITYKDFNKVSYTFVVLRNNVPYKTIEAYSPGTLTFDADSELKLSWQGTFLQFEDVNFITDKLQIDCEINGTIFTLGIFCVTTETPREENGVKLVDVEAYSLLLILKQTILENRVTYAAGTLYTAVINGLIEEAGFRNYEIEPSDAVLATDREDWEIGTDYLTIINELLDEINYNSLYVTPEGKITATKYTPPSVSNIKHVYAEGEGSVVSANYKLMSDRYSKANVFIVICDNPDMEQPLRAESVNNDANSPYSVINLGRRIATVQYVNNTPSLSELQSYADKLNAQSKQTNEIIEYETAVQPNHEMYDSTLVMLGDAAGVYRETGFEIDMSEGGQMTHTAERVII